MQYAREALLFKSWGSRTAGSFIVLRRNGADQGSLFRALGATVTRGRVTAYKPLVCPSEQEHSQGVSAGTVNEACSIRVLSHEGLLGLLL